MRRRLWLARSSRLSLLNFVALNKTDHPPGEKDTVFSLAINTNPSGKDTANSRLQFKEQNHNSSELSVLLYCTDPLGRTQTKAPWGRSEEEEEERPRENRTWSYQRKQKTNHCQTRLKVVVSPTFITSNMTPSSKETRWRSYFSTTGDDVCGDCLTSRDPILGRSFQSISDTGAKGPSTLDKEKIMNDSIQDPTTPIVVTQTTQDDEVDSRDSSPFAKPIHSLTAADVMEAKPSKPRLTLSAFRRPEHTVRLTQSDPDRTLEADYDLSAPGCGVLGHGAFSTVRLAVSRTDGVQVAVKSIAKHDALRSRRLRLGGRRYLEEWEILRRMHDHPNVITLLDVYETDEEIQLVTEYCRGGELFDAIQKKRNRTQAMRRGQYTEAQAAHITTQILRALVDLHAQGIVHRDVKAENILLVDDDDSSIHVKLCDFGVARSLVHVPDSSGDSSPITPGRSRAFSMLGSNYYVAPEVSFAGVYDTAIDIYSLGVTIYILLCGFPPVFSGPDIDAEVMFPTTYWKDISEDAKDLVEDMLNPDPAERINAKDALKNKWISRHLNAAPLPRRPQIALHKEHQINLDLVRSRLYKSLGALESSPTKKPTCREQATASQPRKRARMERRASTALMALADLYRGVAASPAKALAASNARDDPIKRLKTKDGKPSFSGPPPTALSF